MRNVEVHSCPELMGLIQEVGFLPLLDSGIAGYSAEAIVDDECRYVVYSDGGWDWPLWKWKGPIVQEGGCVYGKFFAGKAGFVSREWWPDLCNWRRSKFPQPVEGSIEETILMTLAENGSLITRELRVRWLHHTSADGCTYRDRGFRISHRQARTGVWLGLVATHHARSTLWARCLSM